MLPVLSSKLATILCFRYTDNNSNLRFLRFVWIFCLTITFCSCNEEKVLSPVNYVKWVENSQNGLRVSKTIMPFKITLQYKPIPYVIAMQERSPVLSRQTYEEEAHQMEGMQYFTLRIEVPGQSTPLLKYNLRQVDDYYDRVSYFSSAMQKDIFLVEGRDTFPCLLHHFERTYELAPYSNFLLGFSRSQTSPADKTILFQDRVLGLPPVSLTISKDAIASVPKIKLN